MKIIYFLISVIISLKATFFIRCYGIKHKIGSFPDHCKVHVGFVPSIGGIGIFAGFMITLLIVISLEKIWLTFTIKYAAILIASLIMLVCGYLDDTRDLSAIPKILTQFVAESIVIISGTVIDTKAGCKRSYPAKK